MDTAVGLLAGLVTFPVVMSFGLQNAVGESTIGALFISIPALASLDQTGRCCGCFSSLIWPRLHRRFLC